MIRFFTLAFPLALAVAASAPALAKKVETPLKRDGRWVMDYADSTCHLSAAFGTGKDKIIVRFSQVGPDEPFRLSLFGKRLDDGTAAFTRTQITFLPSNVQSEWRQALNGSISQSDGKLPALFVEGVRLDNLNASGPNQRLLPAVTPEIEKNVHTLLVRRNAGSFALNLETMGPPMAAMRKCADELVRHWGFDPQELKSRQSRAQPLDVRNWLDPRNYPKSLSNKSQAATVAFRMMIDATGTPTDCIVQEATSPREVGPETCRLLMRSAKFLPARDKDGIPVSDFFASRASWYMRE